MGDFWMQSTVSAEMPEEYVHRLAESKIMTVRHLLARLTDRITWRGQSVFLAGALPEVPVKHRAPKPTMEDPIPLGQVWVGYDLAERFGIKPGDTIQVQGKELKVARCLAEDGTKNHQTLFAHLHDVQEILGRPGSINMIEALECRCQGERLKKIRAEIAQVLPETRVVEKGSIAIARAETRDLIENYAAILIPIVFVITALWVGLLALGNVHQRRTEIGTLRALGWSSGRVAVLFLGKAMVMGLVGAAFGFALGTVLTWNFAPEVFPVTSAKIQPMYGLLAVTLLGTPLLCAIASYVPAMLAVTQDPAVVLCRE
jgi:putative ABC transport system permease protein